MIWINIINNKYDEENIYLMDIYQFRALNITDLIIIQININYINRIEKHYCDSVII